MTSVQYLADFVVQLFNIFKFQFRNFNTSLPLMSFKPIYLNLNFWILLNMSKMIVFLLFLTVILAVSPQYDESLAVKMINISTASYTAANVNNIKHCPECYRGFQVDQIVQAMSFLAIVGYDPTINRVVVSFRGSDNVWNWAADARVRHSLYSGFNCLACLVHVGFRDGLSILYQFGLKGHIAASLQTRQGAGIIFTGHSLGGALANLAAIRFLQNNPDYSSKLQVYTLGQPRVGDMRYASYHAQKIPHNFRIIHAKDIVPHQPAFLLIGLLYRHSGWEIWYDQEMKNKRVCYGDSNDCSNSLGSLVQDYSVGDHSSKNYIKLGLHFSLNQEL